ncbi:Oidioi.mRNA.OKI2018_I69.chr2.g4843.t1.cds [Oikopleura dioica]|uniref:Oidioi.mRNA.OKI2018_I69.chr2.g4843.t1.cds n=1 Tax=Oikopleura dioica TaxID=34765 RepID=A0ABN7T544_OIKDI|nr:Oidioi.mRNA.OKI2018_I69.chr2.g4843.t1.cds [Oikopleura dioica]
MADRFDGQAKHIIFTGPDGSRDHRSHLTRDGREVGIGPLSTEATSENDFICRQKELNQPWRRVRVGDVGWNASRSELTTALDGGFKGIRKGPFRAAAEFQTANHVKI